MARTPRTSAPSRAPASKARPLSRRTALRQARAAIREIAERALVIEPARPGACRYALAYLESLSSGHPIQPPTNPAEEAKLTDPQAEMMVGVITAVLDGLGLPYDQWTRGSKIASEALRACSTQDWEP